MPIHVHLIPELTSPQELAGSTVVLIDILRATTTINYALAAGATQVLPCLEIQEARKLAQQQAGKVLLGGERGGKPIEGFQMGNSPADYTTELVSNSTVVFTTTNGTKALGYTTAADRVLIGAFVNLSAIVAAVAATETLHLLCAGTNGKITREDVLFAGAVVERLDGLPDSGPRCADRSADLNDSARLALSAWADVGPDRYSSSTLAKAFRDTRGGQNLIEIGMQDDLPRAAIVDQFVNVPELDVSQRDRSPWSIRCRPTEHDRLA